jgi:hypothetical protein
MTHECILTCAYVMKTVNRNLHSNEMRLTDRYNVNTCICPCNNFRDILHKKASVSVHNYPQRLVTISPPSTLKSTQRRNLKCQIFMQTFFKIVCIGVLTSFAIILVLNWSLINIFLIFRFLFVIIFTYLQL